METNIPACASPHDEILQISGDINSTRKALLMVSQILIKPPRKDPFPSNRSTHTNPRGEPHQSVQFHSPHFPKFRDVGMGQNQGSPEFLVFRMLCSNDKAGSVIGKSGSTVRSLQLETGSEIKILETTPETGDRLIVISGPAIPFNGVSPAQDGLLRVQKRIAAVTGDYDNVLARLIVASNQIGCVFEKGGFVINEMRKLNEANIH